MADYVFLNGTHYVSGDSVTLYIPDGYYNNPDILGRYLYIYNNSLWLMLVYSVQPTQQGWQSRLYDNTTQTLLSSTSDSSIINEIRDGVTYYATSHLLRITYSSYTDTNWYYSSEHIINWSTPDYSESNFISQIPYSFPSDALSACLDDILSPSNPYTDMTLYTQGSGTNSLFTFTWEGLSNIPSGYTSEDFKIRFGVTDTSGDDGLLIALTDYDTNYDQFSYGSLYNGLATTQLPAVESNGYFFVNAMLVYTDHDTNALVECNDYTFKIYSDGTVSSEGTESGGDIVININTDPGTDDVFNDGSGDLNGQTDGLALSVDNLLTTSYAMTEAELLDFGSYIWSNDLEQQIFDNQVAPLENVLSCKRIPFDVTGINQEIRLGNLFTGKYGSKTSNTLQNHTQEVGTYTLPIFSALKNTFLHFAPYTTVSIYLPYIGIQALNTNALYYCENDANGVPTVKSRTIKVVYYFDIVYATCVACVYVQIVDSGSNVSWVMLGSYNGECGVDIPLTASNRASNQLALIKQGANTVASTIGALSSGNVFGALGNMIQGNLEQKIEQQTAETHFTTSGGMSSQVASYLPKEVTLFIEYPNYTKPDKYEEVYGYPCNLTRNLSSLRGFTLIGHEVNLGNIPCFEEEKQLLYEILTQDGIIL